MPASVKFVAALLAAAALAWGGWWWWTTKVMPPPVRPAHLENNGTQTVQFSPADPKLTVGRTRKVAPGGRDVTLDFTEPCTLPWVVRDVRGKEIGRVERLCEGDRIVVLGPGSVVLRRG